MAIIKTNARSASALDATILTGNLPAISGASLTGVSAGKVLQVINGTSTTETIKTGSSTSDTGLTASITPASSSNKVLAFAHVQGVGKNGDGYVVLKLVRDSYSETK